MKLAKFIEYLRNHLKTVIRVSLAVLVLLVLVDAFVINKAHAHTRPEHFPGFWSIFGLVGCAVIIFVSKWFGHAGIMQREDYYDE
jgi:predicted membrane-bound mannosyltransferase